MNLREQKLKRSSKLGPRRSITNTLYSFSVPYHLSGSAINATDKDNATLTRTLCAECPHLPEEFCTALTRTVVVGAALCAIQALQQPPVGQVKTEGGGDVVSMGVVLVTSVPYQYKYQRTSPLVILTPR